MAKQLKDDFRQCLRSDLTSKAADIHKKYGPALGWDQLQTLLQDREFTPFPCEIRFDSEPLLPGEFGHPVPKGTNRADGFIIYLHPVYASQQAFVPYLVLHQLVLINYDCASIDDAETFGSLALGLSKEDYYQALCNLSGQVGGDDLL